MPPTLVVRVVGDTSLLERSFHRATNSSRGFETGIGKASRGALAASLSFHGLGRSLAFASSSFVGGAGLAFLGKQVISETSRVQEELEKTSVVFGKNAQQVQAWSKTLAQSFGISEGAALEATGKFGNMLAPLGFGTEQASKMSERLVELAADLASFNNAKPDEVLAALSSGLAGQVRPLRQYGVFLTQARIANEAVADGLSRTGKNMSQATKLQAAYNIILKDTKNAQGDVARNTESLSVAQSKLTAGIQDTEAGLGEALLPSLTAYLNKSAAWLNDTKNQERIQRDFKTAIHDTGVVLHDTSAIVKAFSDGLGGPKHALELLGGTIVAFKVTSLLDSFSGIAGSAKVASGEVSLLRLRLIALQRLGPIALVVTVSIFRKQIAQKLDDSNFLGSRDVDKFVADKLGGRNLFNKLFGKEFVDKEIGPGSKLDTAKLAAAVKLGDSFAKSVVDAIGKRAAEGNKQAQQTLAELKSLLGGMETAAMKAAEKLDAAFANIQAPLAGPVSLQRPVPDQQANLKRRAFGQAVPLQEPVSRPGLTATQRNSFFDAGIDRDLGRVQDITAVQGQIGRLQQIAGLISARIAKTKDITRRLNLEDKLLDVFRQIKDDRSQLAQNFVDGLQLGVTKAQATEGTRDDIAALNALAAGIRARIKAEGDSVDLESQLFDVTQQLVAVRKQNQQSLIDVLQFGVTKAAATAGFGDDVAALEKLQAAIKAEIASTGKTLELSQNLFDVQQQLKAAKNSALSAKDFRLLGFGPTGEDIIPGKARLKKELAAVQGLVAGTTFDTPKLKTQLAAIGKLLTDALVPADVRSKMQELLANLRKQLEDHAGNLTKFHKANTTALIKASGVTDPETIRRLRASLSQVGAGGTVPGAGTGAFGVPTPAMSSAGPPIVVQTTVNLDGKTVAVNTTKHQQTTRRRNPRQKRGPHAGGD